MFKDILNREIKIGDVIAVPRSVTSSPFLDIGIVVKINPKSLNILEIKTKEWRLNLVTKEWEYLPIDPKIGVGHRVYRPNRTLIVSIDSLPDTVRTEILKQLRVLEDEKQSKTEDQLPEVQNTQETCI